MGMAVALGELHRSESLLLRELLALGERHRDEPEVHHVAGDLATWSREHVRELAATAPRYGLEPEDLSEDGPEPLGGTRGDPGEPLDTRSDPDLLLLADLRRLYRTAAGVSLDWELLGQGAQALADTALLALTRRCHPQTERQMNWADGMLRALSRQVLSR
ncbi:hypothetical protein ACIRPH_16975 [Nocardiopsis sp. NPDC101807]|uniref:hypothetical protein n=1 Tax=Nocardiopsis sp. NPDC101807 TaxID=3364339 RepID=UPI00382E3287